MSFELEHMILVSNRNTMACLSRKNFVQSKAVPFERNRFYYDKEKKRYMRTENTDD